MVFACPFLSEAADTFSVSVPAGTEVTMQDPEAVLPLTITNNSTGKDIREITFTVDTAKYNISSSTLPPNGWCVKTVSTQSITLALTQASGACSSGSAPSQIGPGGSLLFNITVLPIAASADISGDSLTSVTVGSQGGFTLSGSLPTWTLRSMEAVLSATPSSTGTGGVITLSMQVTNRSTAAQSTIDSTPSPPSFSSAIVTNTAGPYYGSTALNGDHTASATIINAGSTTEFSSTGTIRIGSEDICYSAKTATSFTGVVRGCNGTTAGIHVSGSIVYSIYSFSLTPGETRTIIWKYSADSSGTVHFTARALNSGSTAKSISLDSNDVVIGSFTAAIAVAPAKVISGQSVTVEMLVTNNGAAALINIVPSALAPCAGGAGEALVSGPGPASITSLAPGSSGNFYWTYQVTGSVGQTYCLSGSASAEGPVTTSAVTSNAGSISSYSVTVAPVTVESGSSNKTFTWTVYNGGGCGVDQVDIQTPASGGNWACSTVTPPSGWSAACSTTVSFSSGSSSDDISSGGTKSFSITFSSTETVTSDKAVSFPVTMTPRGCGGASTTLGTAVTVTENGLALAHSPAGPIYADGSSAYEMTATLTSGGNPVSGKTVTFSTTNGSLSPSTAVTDANGQARVSLMAPNSTTDTASTVTASYINASATDMVNFTGWTKANLQYWSGLTPVAADCGSTYSFTMSVRNISPSVPMSLTAYSYFSFNDSSAGGVAVYKAYLNSPVTISPSSTQTLTFGSKTSAGGGGGVKVKFSFLAGSYTPVANSSPPPESGLFFTDGGPNDQYRAVTDSITLSGDCGLISIIEWHEMR